MIEEERKNERIMSRVVNVSTYILTPNEDTQFLDDEVTKGRKGKSYATGYTSHLFVTNWTNS